MLISAIYRPPRDDFDNNLWTTLFQKVEEFNNFNRSSSIILGDFNCHHFSWNCNSKQDAIGTKLIESIEDSNFIILNNGCRTYLTGDLNSISAVDLSIVSADLVATSSWSVHNDTLLSDHFPIFLNITLNTSFSNSNTFSHKISTKNVDWLIFKNHLRSIDMRNNYNNLKDKTIQEKYDFVIDSVFDALAKAKPTYKKKKKNGKNRRHNSNQFNKKMNNTAPWWDENCNKLIQERKKYLDYFLKNPLIDNWILYKKINAKTKRELRKIKIQKFREFTETLSRDSSLDYVWKIVKKFKHCVLNNCTQYTNDYSYIKSSNSFVEEFCRPIPFVYSPPLIDDTCNNIKNIQLNNSFLDVPFSMQELEYTVNSLKIKSAPGLDKISNEIISNFPSSFLLIILDLFNEIFRQHIFPSQWKNFLITLIPKSSPGKVRPIALASCLLKCLEKMIYFRLNFFLEHNNLLSPFQFGFRKKSHVLTVFQFLLLIFTIVLLNKNLLLFYFWT